MSDVRVSTQGTLARLTLDRPKALNALTLDMVRAIDAALSRWADDPAIGAVLIDAAGERAFCAGGDIRVVAELIKAGELTRAAVFFAEEYRLNGRLARYPKPIVSVMFGVTMGGGIGVGAHVAHRVVTGSSKLAMPEVGIGFAPDVGGTYLLGTAPGELGTHVALTGSVLGAADAIACGLADRFIAADRLDAIADRLAGCRTDAEVHHALEPLSGDPGASALAAGRAWIDRCYAGDDLGAIMAALQEAPEPDARAAAERIAAVCPMSVAVTLRALRNARRFGTLEPCLSQELAIAMRITRRADFIEGVRAAVIDKDRQPRWQPARLAGVDPAEVARHFEPLDAEERGRVAAVSGRTGS